MICSVRDEREVQLQDRDALAHYSHVAVSWRSLPLQVQFSFSPSTSSDTHTCTEPTMLSTRPLALDDGPAIYAYTRTPAKGLMQLKSRRALQENTTTVLRGPKTLNTGKGKAVALSTPTQNRQYSGKC